MLRVEDSEEGNLRASTRDLYKADAGSGTGIVPRVEDSEGGNGGKFVARQVFTGKIKWNFGIIYVTEKLIKLVQSHNNLYFCSSFLGDVI